MLGVSIYSTLIAYFEIHSFLNDNVKELTKSISTIYSILGFTLSLLLVFRTNSAYERWWEGRRLWGELTNANRAFCSHLNALLSIDCINDRIAISKLVQAYAFSLQSHLKAEKLSKEYFSNLFDTDNLSIYVDLFSQSENQPMTIYKEIIFYVQKLNNEKKLGSQEIYHFKSELNKYIDVLGGCERIKNTPIPFSYSVFIKKFIFFYVMLFPLIYCVHMSFFIIPVTVFVLYVLASVELIAEEIEDPFNGDPNDLPTFELAMKISDNAKQILL
jgi:putative membrane protein